MEKDSKSEIHITNNFNAPIGQHIDHVDTINFSMDKEGSFHFENIGQVNGDLPKGKTDPMTEGTGNGNPNEELFKFIHPSITGEEERMIHEEVKRLVKRQGVPDICRYLQTMAKEKKILLPQMSSVAYAELIRLGMPNGEGYSEKYFTKHYNK